MTGNTHSVSNAEKSSNHWRFSTLNYNTKASLTLFLAYQSNKFLVLKLLAIQKKKTRRNATNALFEHMNTHEVRQDDLLMLDDQILQGDITLTNAISVGSVCKTINRKKQHKKRHTIQITKPQAFC